MGYNGEFGMGGPVYAPDGDDGSAIVETPPMEVQVDDEGTTVLVDPSGTVQWGHDN